MHLQGFRDASELAYARVVYLRPVDQYGCIHVSLVLAKTRVVPIKCLIILTLELCGAVTAAKLLSHVVIIHSIPTKQVYAWSYSVVVLSWLVTWQPLMLQNICR